jgi:hypothetical protein
VATADGKTGGKDNAVCRHSSLSEDLGINHNDINHGYERREASQQFLLHRRLILNEREIAIDQSSLLDFTRIAKTFSVRDRDWRRRSRYRPAMKIAHTLWRSA